MAQHQMSSQIVTRQDSESADKNKLGQSLGKKGHRTRRQIMDAVIALLEEKHLWDIRLRDISESAGIPITSFYTYFSNINEILLAITEQIREEQKVLARHLEGTWEGPDGLAKIKVLVRKSIDFWSGRRGVLLVLDLLADEGDPKFLVSRIHILRDLHDPIERHIKAAQAAGRISPSFDADLGAYMATNLLIRSTSRYELTKRTGRSKKRIVDTTAESLHRLVTGGETPETKVS